MSTGLYCYAIVRNLSPADLAGGTGIDDAPLHLVEHRGLGAVVSPVDLDEFGEQGLRRNLEDLGWLERVALAHDRVSRHASERAATAPLRLATVFIGEDSVREQLERWHDAAERALDRVEGRTEWSVKLYVDEGARPSNTSAEDEQAPSADGPGSGKAHLLKRRAAVQRREAAVEADAATAEEIHSSLADVSVASRRLATQDRKLTGHTGEMIFNGTYLLDRSQVAAFNDMVERVSRTRDYVRVELGGPWPPYSFASLEVP